MDNIIDSENNIFICGRCKIQFVSAYGEKEAFCPRCGQHSKTHLSPNKERDFSKEWKTQPVKAPEYWPDGTKNAFYIKEK